MMGDSSSYGQQVEQLLAAYLSTEDSAEQVTAAEAMIAHADRHGDAEFGYHARMALIDAASSAGQAEKLLDAFSWCLERFDADPTQHEEEQLLWYYKWIVEHVPEFTDVSRERIEDLFGDMERRYRNAGLGLRPLYECRTHAAVVMGDKEKAAEYERRWLGMPRNPGADCLACECDKRVEYLLFAGCYEEAIEEAAPVLAGALRCGQVPTRTLARVLVPLLRLERPAEAGRYHLLGIGHAASERQYLWYLAEHLAFLVLIRNLAEAVALFQRHLPWALEIRNSFDRFRFYRSAWLLLRILTRDGHEAGDLCLPPAFETYRRGHTYDLNLLEDRFRKEADKLAQDFDERNGTPYYAELIHEIEEWDSPMGPCVLGDA